MSETDKITREEMIEMFGEMMPIEAVSLLWEAPGEMTLGEMRAELRRIAAQRKSDRTRDRE